MLKLLRHLLCLGLLLGLAGNGIAVAAPCMWMVQSEPTTMTGMPDCEMTQSKSQSHENDQSKIPGCMAMVACTAVLATKEPSAQDHLQHRTTTLNFWPVAAILDGRDVAPEPEPPALLD